MPGVTRRFENAMVCNQSPTVQVREGPPGQDKGRWVAVRWGFGFSLKPIDKANNAYEVGGVQQVGTAKAEPGDGVDEDRTSPGH